MVLRLQAHGCWGGPWLQWRRAVEPEAVGDVQARVCAAGDWLRVGFCIESDSGKPIGRRTITERSSAERTAM